MGMTKRTEPRSQEWRTAQSRSSRKHYDDLRARGELPLGPMGPASPSWKGGSKGFWQARAREAAFAAHGQRCSMCLRTEGLLVINTCPDKTNIAPEHLRVYCNSCHRKVMNERGLNKPAQETCKRGHPFTPENTLSYPRKGQKGVKRICRTCNALRARVAWKKREDKP
jgi:hypothetical protein